MALIPFKKSSITAAPQTASAAAQMGSAAQQTDGPTATQRMIITVKIVENIMTTTVTTAATLAAQTELLAAPTAPQIAMKPLRPTRGS